MTEKAGVARRSFWTQVKAAGLILFPEQILTEEEGRTLFVVDLDPARITEISGGSSASLSAVFGLGGWLIQETENTRTAIPASGVWETLVTQSVVPKLLSRPRLDDDHRYPWELNSNTFGPGVGASYPESCIRILGVLRLVGKESVWSTNEQTRKGDPLLTAAATTARDNNNNLDVSSEDAQDRVCRVINLLYDAAMIYVSSKGLVHVVSPQAYRSWKENQDKGRSTSLFFGGADDYAHVEMGLLANNWLGGVPDSARAWAVWKLASEIGPSAPRVEEIFVGLDRHVNIDPGRTLRDGQTLRGEPSIPTVTVTPEEEEGVLQLQEEVKTLKFENGQLAETKIRLQEETHNLRGRVDQLRGQLTVAQKQIRDLEALSRPTTTTTTTTTTDPEAIKKALEGIQSDLEACKQFIQWLGVPAGSSIIQDVVPLILGAGLELEEYLKTTVKLPVFSVIVDSEKKADLRALKEQRQQQSSGHRLLSVEHPNIDKHFGRKAVLRVNQRLRKVVVAPVMGSTKQAPAPPIGRLTRTLVGSILVAAKSPSVGTKMVRDNSMEWAKAAVSSETERIELKGDLMDLSRGIINNDSDVRTIALTRICRRVPSINGYREDFSALASQVASAASAIRNGMKKDADLRKCLESARLIGESIERGWGH